MENINMSKLQMLFEEHVENWRSKTVVDGIQQLLDSMMGPRDPEAW